MMMNEKYTVKDFIKEVFNPFGDNHKKNQKYRNYILIVRLLIVTKITLLLSVFIYG
jgi:hypothetical protein